MPWLKSNKDNARRNRLRRAFSSKVRCRCNRDSSYDKVEGRKRINGKEWKQHVSTLACR